MNKIGNPSLAYLYRRWLACKLVKNIPPGRFLEIGVGSGSFYKDLLARGFHGVGLDLNPDLVAEHRACGSYLLDRIQFRTLDFFDIEGQFDLVVAFEVLEHYEDDLECLERWKGLLSPSGTLIFSVPAHRAQWTENDSRAGHARRYEKSELYEKLSKTGLRVDELWCYGYPVLNLTYPLSSRFRLSRKTTGKEELKSPNAGCEKAPLKTIVSNRVSEPLMTNYDFTCNSGARRLPVPAGVLMSALIWWPFLLFQRIWIHEDRGIGYLVKCQHLPLAP